MDYTHAKNIADELLTTITPYCEIANIAGSVRRKVPEPGDIEIVCLPKKTIIEHKDLFGNVTKTEIITDPDFERIVTGWGKVIKGQPSGRMMAIDIERTIDRMDWMIQIDLFMPQPHDYYRQYAIRTGSKEYAHRYIASQWLKKGWCGTKNGLRKLTECYKAGDSWQVQKQFSGRPSLPPVWHDEKSFFEWLGVVYLRPEDRCL